MQQFARLPDTWTIVDLELLPAGVGARRYEIIDGALVVSPTAGYDHELVDLFGQGRLALGPAEVLLAVEVVSPGSRVTDRVTKPAQYAAAGVPAYWRVETEPELALAAYSLPAGADVYSELGSWPRSERAHLTEPFAVTISFDELGATS
jgi:hypothetical protein